MTTVFTRHDLDESSVVWICVSRFQLVCKKKSVHNVNPEEY